jgi:hypothetical protein
MGQSATLNPLQLHLTDSQSDTLNLSFAPPDKHVPELTNLFNKSFRIEYVAAHVVLGVDS